MNSNTQTRKENLKHTFNIFGQFLVYGWLPGTQQCQYHYFQFDQQIFQSYDKWVRDILHTEYAN